MNKKLEDLEDLEELRDLYEFELSCLEEIGVILMEIFVLRAIHMMK